MPVAAGTGTADAALKVRVNAIGREADEICSFELVDPDGAPLPSFSAGAHVDVRIADGLLRQYSLCNDPSETHRYLIAVLHEPDGRGGSKILHETVKVGDTLTISSPRNHFALAGREASFHLLLAGGIGVTPMMAMMHELEDRAADYRLHYCTREPGKTAFLDRLQPRIDAGKVMLHHDGGDPTQGLDIRATLAPFTPGMHCYVCGPPGFMSAAMDAVGAWPPHAVHREYFTSPEQDEERVDAPFQVRLSRSGHVLDVPADRSIVDVLRAHGLDIETSCEDGYCGTCMTRYLGGEPEHRDTVLDDGDRKKYVMICCARATGAPLVLDL
ncbi:MAG: PDR/VanB family oxidoreductase [Hyphomicrobiales bacterium]|nr:PDR/VanB family oxidoreductase [Hyphomicrobiales bacterium]